MSSVNETDSIPGLLESWGVLSLGRNPSIEGIEASLQKMHAALASGGIGTVRELLIKKEVIKCLKNAQVLEAAELVAAVCASGNSVVFAPCEPTQGLGDDNGEVLLNEVHATIRRNIILTEHETVSATLWVAQTYCTSAFGVAPILGITSPTKRCGKTQFVILISALAHRALSTSNISPAALFRVMDAYGPTLLIDEADTKFSNGNGSNEELRSILNAGNTRTTALVFRTGGPDFEVRPFSCYGPKVLAGIGQMPDTIEDRSIKIVLRRKTRMEHVERLRADRIVNDLEWLRCGLAGWCGDRLDRLKSADPDLPEALNDRARDNWRPLIAIANLVGGSWPVRARQAAIRLESDSSIDDPGTLLLSDLRALFNRTNSEFLLTETILTDLTSREDRPWLEWGKQGEPISAVQLARLLKPFGVKPNQHRDGEDVQRGYFRDPCRDAFARYLSPIPS
jgi:putative DNA primase/helicase